MAGFCEEIKPKEPSLKPKGFDEICENLKHEGKRNSANNQRP